MQCFHLLGTRRGPQLRGGSTKGVHKTTYQGSELFSAPVLGVTCRIASFGRFLLSQNSKGKPCPTDHRFYRTLPVTGRQAAIRTQRQLAAMVLRRGLRRMIRFTRSGFGCRLPRWKITGDHWGYHLGSPGIYTCGTRGCPLGPRGRFPQVMSAETRPRAAGEWSAYHVKYCCVTT